MSNQKTQSIHRGQALKKVVYESGIKIAVLARKIEKSRRWIYIMFDNQNVPLHYVKSVCEAINHPVRNLFDYKLELGEELVKDHWKDKYLNLLEEHNKLLKLHYGKH